MSLQTSVVVVHGLWMTGIESFLLQRHLHAQTGWSTVSFRYSSVKDPVGEIVERLANFIQQLPQGPVHLVGHSLGGVIIHRLVHGMALGRPGRAVLLCSPIQGSRAAASLARLPLGARMLGKSVRATLLDPRPRSWEAEREAGVIAGTRSLGFGRLIGAIDKPNDGTVTIAETRLPGATDSIDLPVSHTSALFSTSVASQAACFLLNGRFRRAQTG